MRTPNISTVTQPAPRVWPYQLALLGALLAGWYGATETEILPPFFFGKPALVWQTLATWISSGSIFEHLAITLLETFLAFSCGTLLGIAVGLWLGLSQFAAALLDPYFKAINAMPRVVLAPIFAMWFGLGIWSKVALGITLVFFIVFFNVYQGVKDVNPVILANAHAGCFTFPAYPSRVLALGAELGVLQPAHFGWHGLRRRGRRRISRLRQGRGVSDPAGRRGIRYQRGAGRNRRAHGLRARAGCARELRRAMFAGVAAGSSRSRGALVRVTYRGSGSGTLSRESSGDYAPRSEVAHKPKSSVTNPPAPTLITSELCYS